MALKEKDGFRPNEWIQGMVPRPHEWNGWTIRSKLLSRGHVDKIMSVRNHVFETFPTI
jgi:hypothetical protein